MMNKLLLRYVYEDRHFASDITGFIVGAGFGLSPLIFGKGAVSMDRETSLTGTYLLSVVIQACFLGLTFSLFNRIRDKGGAAIIFCTLVYYLNSDLNRITPSNFFHGAPFGFVFWSLIFFIFFLLLEQLRYSRNAGDKAIMNLDQSDELVVLNLTASSRAKTGVD